MRKFAVSFVVVVSLVAVGVSEGKTYEVKPITAEQAAEYKLDTAFYTKGTAVQGILIATSDGVSDLTHREAAYQFDMIMKRIDRKVAKRIRERKVLCVLIGCEEFTSEVPQFGTDKTGEELDYYNWRSRGFLTWKGGRPTVVFAEEDVLEYEGGMQIESILIHEFGHVIAGAGFDEALQKRLTETFEKAKEQGLWNDGRAAQRFRRVEGDGPVRLLDALVQWFPGQGREFIETCINGGSVLVNGGPVNSKAMVTAEDKVLIVFGGEKECYAGKNRAEYWAEGVQNWYDTNRTLDHDHNHIHTREQLKVYDPGLAALCADVLGESKWRFVSPRERAGKRHLKRYDLAEAPAVVDPAHIKKAANDYYDEYWAEYWGRLRDKYVADEAKVETTASSDGDYEVVDVRGWAFHVHKDYLNGDAGVLANALKNADVQLGHVEAVVPAGAVAKLREIPIWVSPGKRTAEYHWARSWLIDNGRNPDMAHSVQISDIKVLERTKPTGPWVLLHELIHGYHDRYVDKDDKKAISAAYKAALEKELYQKVLHTKRGKGTYIKAYAATRMEEYFAETCEAYFGCNDFYPFVRAELLEYDPGICEIIERVFRN